VAEYEKIHICDEVIENESSGDRGLDVSVSVDTLGKVIIEFGSSMTIRTDWSGAQALALLMEDAVGTLDEMEDNATAEANDDEQWGRSDAEDSSDRKLHNDPVDW
jgi:hypothetical protein